MRRVLNLLFILSATALVGLDTVAQEIKVISGVDNVPLPYATVTNHTHPWVVSADKNGIARFAALTGDTLSISYIGYKTAVLRFSGDGIQVVRLLQEQKILPRVTIRSCRKTKAFRYNNFEAVNKLKENNRLNGGFGGVIWSKGGNTNAKIAVRLSPLKTQATLQDFSFWIEKEREAPKSSILIPLLISFYEVADSTNLPGQALSYTPVIYFPKKGGKQTIRLDTLHVQIPPNGIYVSLQYILNEEYEWKQLFWHTDSTGARIVDSVRYRYGGVIRGLHTKDFDLVWYNGIKDEWLSVGERRIPSESFHSSIKCEATLRFCDED